MKKELEEQKNKIKEEMNKNIDEYFERFEELKKKGDLDINKIEQIWKQEREKTDDILTEATEKAVNIRDIESKKNSVPNVEENNS